jgi:hypothetical protein
MDRHHEHTRPAGPAPGLSVADDRPLPVLRLPRRRLPARQRAAGTRRGADRARPGAGLRRPGRLAHVPRPAGARLPAAPAPRLRDSDHRAPGPGGPRGLAGRHRALRGRRRAVADGRQRHPAQRDVPVAGPHAAQPAGAVPDLAEPAGAAQDGAASLHDVLGRADPAPAGRRGGRHLHRRPPGQRRALATTARFLGRAGRFGPGDLDAEAGARRTLDAAACGRQRHAAPAVLLQGRRWISTTWSRAGAASAAT